MPTIASAFAPPAYWQAFEELTRAVAAINFSDPSPSKVGSPGQAQDGLDVTARTLHGIRIGIQCKRRSTRDPNGDVLAGGGISVTMVKKALKEVDDGRYTVDLFIYATTANAKAPLQLALDNLRTERRTAGKSDVLVWSWADYESALNRNASLQLAYYDLVPQGLSDPERDRHILQTFSEAFSRPALRDRLNVEHPGDLKAALGDVRLALVAGQLYTRQGQLVRQAIGGFQTLADVAARRSMLGVLAALDLFRDELAVAESSGQAGVSGSGYIFYDPALQQRLEGLRRGALDKMNAVLVRAGMPPVC